MPLIKGRSAKAFSKNVETEMEAGKPQKQSLAIAYDMKRRNKPRQKLVKGGEVLDSVQNALGTGDAPSYKTTPGSSSTAPTSSKPDPHTEDQHLPSSPSVDLDEQKSQNWANEAEGGEIMKPKMQMKKSPRMVASSIIKPRIMNAQGGMIDEDDGSAANEKRPMPDNRYNDSKDVSQNSGKKPLKDSDWTGRPTVEQAQRPSPSKQVRPKIQGENDFDGNELITADKPDGYGKQPKSSYNEEEASKSGPKVSDMAREHSNGRKPYAKGGEINDKFSMKDAEEDQVQHPAGLEEDDDQMGPAKSEFMDNDHMAPMLAKGGMLDDEMEEERHDSIAAAIMAKRDRMHAMIDSGAMDEDNAAHSRMASGGSVQSGSMDMNYADGGEVDLDLNSMEQPNSYYPRNEDEVLKENYDSDFKDVSQPEDSNEKGDDIDSDSHDHIDEMRRRMKSRRQF